MSWLYSVLFAGLVLSAGDTAVPPRGIPIAHEASTLNVAQDQTEKFERSYPLNAGGRVNVSNINGSITVEAWDRNEVKLEYTKIAETRERLADVEVQIESKPEYFGAEVDYGSWKGEGFRWRSGKLNVEMRLMVPRGAVLNEIETVNGSVSVSNFTNVIRVSAVNGSVSAVNIRGTAKLSTVNGEVRADFDRLEAGSKITLDTVNGRANLVIPSDANATLRADSLNGSITNDFGLPVRKGKYVGRDLYGRIGNGDVQIKLNSVNGGLSITRKNDGKSPSPAINLLPNKEKDDAAWDGDEHADFDKLKIDKEVAKAVKESTKASAKALADTQLKLNKIQPEIAKSTAAAVKATERAVEQAAVKVNSEEFKEKVREAQRLERERARAFRMSDLAFFSSVPRVEKKSDVFPVKGVPKVTVEGKGCSVTVRGWDKNEVQYRVTQFTDPRNTSGIMMNETHADSTLSIRVENPSHAARGGDLGDLSRQVRIEVFVPRKANLKITANGEIRLEGVSGDVEVVGSDGAINVRDMEGAMRLSTDDGRIRVIGFKGDIEAKTADGEITLEGDFRRLNAVSTDGSVFLTLPDSASADLLANCSEVAGDGIAVTRIGGDDEQTRYRIGKGGPLYTVNSGNEIRIRGANAIKEDF